MPTETATPDRFPALVQALTAEGFLVGAPPWLSRSEVLDDAQSYAPMKCGECRAATTTTFLHRPAPRQNYRLVCWCPSCGFAETA